MPIMLDRLLIVCWHNVESAYSSPHLPGRGRDGFRAQIRLLSKAGRVVSLEEGMRRLGEGTLGPRGIALTFDDGYRDNLDVAAPLLESHGLPATVFLVPEFLSGTRDPWWERLAWALEQGRPDGVRWRGQSYPTADGTQRLASYQALSAALKRLDQAARSVALDEVVALAEPAGTFPTHELMLDWEGARGLLRRGIGIGGHASGHAVLANESAEAQREDLAACRRAFDERLGLDVATLAYPNGGPGDFNGDTVAAARAAGFRYAATGVDGWNGPATPPYELHRIFVTAASGPRGLVRALKRWLDPRNGAGAALGTSGARR
jgi:peptidoglycan/xylan/chitin deacetylase (PgdA/CDA1 family)